MTDLQALKIIVQRLKIMGFGTQKEIGKLIGYTNESSFSQILNGKVKIPADIFERLSVLSPDIKKFIGETLNVVNGDYRESESNYSITPRLEAKPLGLADPDGFDATGEKIYELPDGSKIMEVKVVPVKSQAGYLHGFPDPEFYEDLPTLKISVNNYHKGSYLAFEVQGDSMTPTDISLINQAVLPGWFVIAREVARHHWKYKLHTHSNSKWVIVHRTEGILIKQIIDHDIENGTITIHSLNPKYEDEVLRLDDCEQIFNVVKTEINER